MISVLFNRTFSNKSTNMWISNTRTHAHLSSQHCCIVHCQLSFSQYSSLSCSALLRSFYSVLFGSVLNSKLVVSSFFHWSRVRNKPLKLNCFCRLIFFSFFSFRYVNFFFFSFAALCRSFFFLAYSLILCMRIWEFVLRALAHSCVLIQLSSVLCFVLLCFLWCFMSFVQIFCFVVEWGTINCLKENQLGWQCAAQSEMCL